jgi:hypothetical protein
MKNPTKGLVSALLVGVSVGTLFFISGNDWFPLEVQIIAGAIIASFFIYETVHSLNRRDRRRRAKLPPDSL